MAKPNRVIHFTMTVEITDDSGHPEEWDWHELMLNTPGIAAFNLISAEERPYSSMEDDPLHHVKH